MNKPTVGLVSGLIGFGAGVALSVQANSASNASGKIEVPKAMLPQVTEPQLPMKHVTSWDALQTIMREAREERRDLFLSLDIDVPVGAMPIFVHEQNVYFTGQVRVPRRAQTCFVLTGTPSASTYSFGGSCEIVYDKLIADDLAPIYNELRGLTGAEDALSALLRHRETLRNIERNWSEPNGRGYKLHRVSDANKFRDRTVWGLLKQNKDLRDIYAVDGSTLDLDGAPLGINHAYVHVVSGSWRIRDVTVAGCSYTGIQIGVLDNEKRVEQKRPSILLENVTSILNIEAGLQIAGGEDARVIERDCHFSYNGSWFGAVTRDELKTATAANDAGYGSAISRHATSVTHTISGGSHVGNFRKGVDAHDFRQLTVSGAQISAVYWGIQVAVEEHQQSNEGASVTKTFAAYGNVVISLFAGIDTVNGAFSGIEERGRAVTSEPIAFTATVIGNTVRAPYAVRTYYNREGSNTLSNLLTPFRLLEDQSTTAPVFFPVYEHKRDGNKHKYRRMHINTVQPYRGVNVTSGSAPTGVVNAAFIDYFDVAAWTQEANDALTLPYNLNTIHKNQYSVDRVVGESVGNVHIQPDGTVGTSPVEPRSSDPVPVSRPVGILIKNEKGTYRMNDIAYALNKEANLEVAERGEFEFSSDVLTTTARLNALSIPLHDKIKLALGEFNRNESVVLIVATPNNKISFRTAIFKPGSAGLAGDDALASNSPSSQAVASGFSKAENNDESQAVPVPAAWRGKVIVIGRSGSRIITVTADGDASGRGLGYYNISDPTAREPVTLSRLPLLATDEPLRLSAFTVEAVHEAAVPSGVYTYSAPGGVHRLTRLLTKYEES